MTTRYFDWYNGSDSNDGLTPSTPWKSYDAKRASITTSDRILTRRGTPQIISTLNMDAKSGVAGAPTVYGVYGEAQVPYCFWNNPSAVGNMILNVSGRNNITFQDIYFDGLAACQYSLYLFASGSTACTAIQIKRSFFTNMQYGQAGLIFGSTATSTGDASDFLIEDSEFFKNPGHGLIPNGAHDVRVRRCKFTGNGFGAPFGGHGFSSKYRVTDATSGWTNTSGTIWQRNLAAYEPDVFYVKTSVSAYKRLDKNTSTPTAPTAGQFGVSAAVLYINVASATNPASQGINYAWGRCYNIVVEDCESSYNVSDPIAIYQEGHGFAFDAYADFSTFRGNKAHHNEGAGMSVNLGDGNLLESNILTENNLSGIVGASCRATNIRHNTLADNNVGPVPNSGEIEIFPNSVVDTSNNIFKSGRARRPYAVSVDPTATLTGSKNNAFGYAQVDRTGALTATVLDDPQLDGDFRPQAATVIAAATYIAGRDFYGKARKEQPNIGAVEDTTSTPRKLLISGG